MPNWAHAFVSIALFVLTTHAANALDCKSLEPRGGASTDTNLRGNLNGKIDGLFSKLAGASTSGEIIFREIKSDVLKEYPNSDDLYIKERIIFLKCSSLEKSSMPEIEIQNNIDNFIKQILLSGKSGRLDKNEKHQETIDVIYLTYADTDNDETLLKLQNLDGKHVIIDTINVDLAIRENYEIVENCFEDKNVNKNKIFDGYIDKKNLYFPVSAYKNDKSCYQSLEFELRRAQRMPISRGGTGIVNILVRKKFLVNYLFEGAFRRINLREVD